MARTFPIFLLGLLTMTSVESARAPQFPGQQAPLTQGRVAGNSFQGQFATGGPHSQLGRQAPVVTAPRISNKAHLVRVGKKDDLGIALERPYEVLFGHPGVNGHNYRNAVYTSLDKFNSTVLHA
ncbi:hypothetical protein BDV59DRAFT_135482 [Aspergillus ambiguus]|uniref:uncharacterized protein n=1 Tax=Aspergillus ambiguus TaxID=176160 RepID=UPI003CCDDD41